MHAIMTPPPRATTPTLQEQQLKKKTAIGAMTKKFISSPLFKKIWTPSSSMSSSISTSSSLGISNGSQNDDDVVENKKEEQEERAQEAFCDPATKCGDIVGDRWRLMSLLGTGTYGAVYMAEIISHHHHRQQQQQYYSRFAKQQAVESNKMAIKVLWKAGLDAEQLALQRLEIDINARLMAYAAQLRLPRNVHPNIVPMRHFHEDAECLYLVMDLHQGTDLYEAIQDVGGLDRDLIKHVFRQIVAAVAHSHDAGVFHRDLKPENVLVTADWQCQLCDYGLSSMEEVTSELGCGSAPYMAPEARNASSPSSSDDHQENNEKASYRCREADIWSLGVLLLNLVFACNPWKVASSADPSFAAFLNDPSVLQRQFGLSDPFYALLLSIFDLNPGKRPTLQMIADAVEKMSSFVYDPTDDHHPHHHHQEENQTPTLVSSSVVTQQMVHPDSIVLSSSPTDVPVLHQTPQQQRLAETLNGPKEEKEETIFVVQKEEPLSHERYSSLLSNPIPSMSSHQHQHHQNDPMTPVASLHYVDAMMHRLHLQTSIKRPHHHQQHHHAHHHYHHPYASTSERRRPMSGILAF